MQVVTVRRDARGDWYVLFDHVLAAAGNTVMVYDEVPPGDMPPPQDHAPNTAA